MFLSMTGFGCGESKKQNIIVVAEVRSVNNRFLDIVTRIPKSLNNHENDIKELIRKKVNRGRISLTVLLQSGENNYLDVKVDYKVASGYKSMLQNLKDKLNLGGDVQLEHILKFSEIFTNIEEETEDENIWLASKEAIGRAIEEMNRMKSQEGKNLAIDLLKRLDKIEEYIKNIKELSKQQIPGEYETLKSRIKEILQTPDVDPGRLELEIAIIADRLDITEECVRFNSHINLFHDLVKNHGFVGRRLNFLIQEMNREVNTIGSKANNSEIAHVVVFVKGKLCYEWKISNNLCNGGSVPCRRSDDAGSGVRSKRLLGRECGYRLV